ncbi:unnamed protein product [Brassica rapa]|uniref:Uncharacterized protein n=1 Tax=Brassica campestris TaxID=3711 RepID=A0A3P6B6K6_BRACM|nr:unnamed protein product [Brassica rapa]VDC91838.1 unnamed protein product [Brassica rapa]
MQAVIAILVFAGLMAVKTTLAAQHVMGGSQGWENPLTSILGRPINLSKSATNWFLNTPDYTALSKSTLSLLIPPPFPRRVRVQALTRIIVRVMGYDVLPLDICWLLDR